MNRTKPSCPTKARVTWCLSQWCLSSDGRERLDRNDEELFIISSCCENLSGPCTSVGLEHVRESLESTLIPNH